MENLSFQETLEPLMRQLDIAKQDLHSINLEKMKEKNPTRRNKQTATRIEIRIRRVSSQRLEKEAAEKALENCRRISSLVKVVDAKVSGELNQKIRLASERLNEASTSKFGLYDWYRMQLVPLLNKSEQIVYLTRKGMSGIEKPKSP